MFKIRGNSLIKTKNFYKWPSYLSFALAKKIRREDTCCVSLKIKSETNINGTYKAVTKRR